MISTNKLINVQKLSCSISEKDVSVFFHNTIHGLLVLAGVAKALLSKIIII